MSFFAKFPCAPRSAFILQAFALVFALGIGHANCVMARAIDEIKSGTYSPSRTSEYVAAAISEGSGTDLQEFVLAQTTKPSTNEVLRLAYVWLNKAAPPLHVAAPVLELLWSGSEFDSAGAFEYLANKHFFHSQEVLAQALQRVGSYSVFFDYKLLRVANLLNQEISAGTFTVAEIKHIFAQLFEHQVADLAGEHFTGQGAPNKGTSYLALLFILQDLRQTNEDFRKVSQVIGLARDPLAIVNLEDFFLQNRYGSGHNHRELIRLMEAILDFEIFSEGILAGVAARKDQFEAAMRETQPLDYRQELAQGLALTQKIVEEAAANGSLCARLSRQI